MGIIINLEGQGKYNPGYPIYNRATYYASQLIVDQKGDEFIGSNYGDMKKVYSVWVMMNPPKELRGTAIEYADTPRYIEPLSSDTPLVHHNLVRKILVNLDTEARAELPVGDELSRNERSSVMMDMLKIVLKDKMAPEKKRDVLKEEYKIPVSNSVFRVIRGIGMSMSNEELFQAYKDAQIEKYLDAMEAEIVAKAEANAEAKAEAKARLKVTAYNVRNLMSKLNLSIDEAMDLLNEDESIREDVRKAIESQGPED